MICHLKWRRPVFLGQFERLRGVVTVPDDVAGLLFHPISYGFGVDSLPYLSSLFPPGIYTVYHDDTLTRTHLPDITAVKYVWPWIRASISSLSGVVEITLSGFSNSP